MGNDCSTPTEFLDQNQCSNGLNARYTIPDFCGNSASCDNLGSEGEWAIYRLDSADGCCDGNRRVTCIRKQFNGDLTECCLKNYDLTQRRQDCFSDPEFKDTCAPAYRGPGGTGCRSQFNEVCVNAPTSLTAMNEAWTESTFCSGMIEQNSTTVGGAVNQSDLNWAQNAMANTFSKFLSLNNNEISGPGLESPFQNYLYNFCLNNPAACQVGLNNSCIAYTNQQVSSNTNIANFCGCHLNDVNYQVYENLYGVSRQCTPVCSRAFTIPAVTTTGALDTCQGTICIIDDVTFQLSNSTIGDINFYQSCGSCSTSGSANCFCSISGVNLQTAESRLGGVDLTQRCQGSLQCFRDNPNDPSLPAVEVSCDAPNDYVPTQQEIDNSLRNSDNFDQSAGVGRSVTISIVVLFIVSVVILLLIVLQENQVGVEQTTYQNTKVFDPSTDKIFS